MKVFIFKLVSTVARMAGLRAANWPRKRERQDGDRSGHTGLSDSLIWDSDDMPSLQRPLSRALERYVGERRGLMRRLTLLPSGWGVCARCNAETVEKGKRENTSRASPKMHS